MNFRTLSLLLLLNVFSAFTIMAQQKITGKVVDEQGIGLPGVNVAEKGTTNGSITDFNGDYTISVASDQSVIIFSFIGYLNQEISVGSQRKIDVTLMIDAVNLQEVVAVGYGTVKKSDLTGSVTSFDTEKLTEQRKTDVAQAIQGQMAGVDVRRTSTKPGAPLAIRIRGNTAISNDIVDKDGVKDNPAEDLSAPLYVVNGIFMDDISGINPSDIEKMDILKDASATAIYGSRGANGVVIITTKSGVEGKMVVSYDGTVGFNSVTNVPEMMSGDKYVAFVDDALRAEQWESLVKNGNGTAAAWDALTIDRGSEIKGAVEQDNVANKRYMDWVEEFQEIGIQTSHSINFSGGSNGLVYSASVGYLSDEGVVGIEDFQRYTASLSLDKKYNDIFSIGMKSYFSYSDREEGSKELFRSSFRLAPTLSSHDSDGEIIDFPDAQDERFMNPLYEQDGSWTTQHRNYAFNASVYLQVKPISWLSFRTVFNPELRSYRYGEHRGLYTKAARKDIKRTRAYYRSNFSNSYTWDNIANIDLKVLPDHKLKATLISSLYYKQKEGSRIENRGIAADQYKFYNIEDGTDLREYKSSYEKETMASFAARFNYDIKSKYLFTFTGRYDGASMLADGHKWDFFPSAAFAWRVSEESFMQDFDWLSNLKLRLSYGEAGNIKPLDPYDSQAFLTASSYLSERGRYLKQLVNPELTWEVSKESNVGLNIGILDNKVSLEFDFYNKETEGALFAKKLMSLTGYEGTVGNFGSVRNRGVEIVLNTVNIRTDDFQWSTSINFTKNKNEILELYGDLDFLPKGRHGVLKVGEPITAMYAYEKEGIWQMNETEAAAVYGEFPGKYKYKDQQQPGEEGHGKLDENDKVVVGSHEPDWIGGITNKFKYKAFDASIMIYTRQGVMGHSEFHQNFAPHQNDGAKFNKIDESYWTPNNPGGKYPLPDVGRSGEWYFEDMSFVRVGNIGVGYNMPSSLTKQLGITKLRLSLDVQNPFTFTDYKGPDPETGLQNSYGMAYSVRTVLFGLNLKF